METRNVFRVVYTKNVAKYIEKQDTEFKKRIEKVIYDLSLNPYDNDGELSGCKNLYKKRFGKFRLLFEIHENILTVKLINLDSRGQVYDRL